MAIRRDARLGRVARIRHEPGRAEVVLIARYGSALRRRRSGYIIVDLGTG